MSIRKMKFYNVEQILSKKNKEMFEKDWEDFLFNPSQNCGGVYSYLCSLYGSPKKVEIEDRQYHFWDQRIYLENKKSAIFSIVYKYKGPVVEDCYFACNRKVSEKNAMIGWESFGL